MAKGRRAHGEGAQGAWRRGAGCVPPAPPQGAVTGGASVALVRVDVAVRGRAHAGDVVVALHGRQRAVLAERADRGGHAVRRVHAVHEVDTGDRQAGARRVVRDVVVHLRAVLGVDRRVGEADRLAAARLLGQGLHGRDHRRGERGAADAVLAVLLGPVREGLRLADLETGVGVGDRRDVRDDAVAGGVVGLGERVRDDALLVGRFGDRLAGAAARARGEGAGEARPALAVGRQAGLLGAPAGLPQVLVVLADRQRGAADRRHPGRVGRGVDLLRTGVGDLVAVVAGGEVEADALDRAELEDLVVGGREVRRLVGLDVAPGVGDDVGEVVVDDLAQRVEQVVVHAGGGAHVRDVRVRRDRVHGLDVQRLLAVPARRVALVGAGVRVLLGQRLVQLAGLPSGVAVLARVRLRVEGDGRRGVGVRDGDPDTLAGVRAGTVGGAQLLAGVSLHRVRD